MGKYTLLAGLFVSLSSFAAFQCGGYKMTLSDAEGLVRINGELVTSQKVKYLGAQGDESKAVWNMTLMPARDGLMYGYEFVKRDGKSFLNVELIRTRMDAPRIIGSFDCKRVPD